MEVVKVDLLDCFGGGKRKRTISDDFKVFCLIN